MKVEIQPEETVDQFDPSSGAIDAPDGAIGRVMAKLINKDDKNNFDELGLKMRDPEGTYAIWWIRTDTDPWQSRYYIVNPQKRTVHSVGRVNARFRVCTGETAPAKHEADWGNHDIDDPDHPCKADTVRLQDGNSTWVSCGMGCCNGHR